MKVLGKCFHRPGGTSGHAPGHAIQAHERRADRIYVHPGTRVSPPLPLLDTHHIGAHD